MTAAKALGGGPSLPIIGLSGRSGCGKDTAADVLVERGWVKVALADPMKRLAMKIFGFTPHALWGPSKARNEIVTLRAGGLWREAFYRAGEALPEIAELYGPAFFDNAVPRPAVSDALLQYLEACVVLDATGEFSARTALQLLGTEMGRGLREDVWVQQVLHVARELAFRGVCYDIKSGLSFVPHATSPCSVSPPLGIVVTDCRFLNEVHALQSNGGRVYWVDADRRCQPKDVGIVGHASEATGGLVHTLDGVIDNNGCPDDLAAQILHLASLPPR